MDGSGFFWDWIESLSRSLEWEDQQRLSYAWAVTASKGKRHREEPSGDSDVFIDFDEDMPIFQPDRARWHNRVLGDIARYSGVEVQDLKLPEELGYETCPKCKGDGKIQGPWDETSKCNRCGGSGISRDIEDPDYDELANRLSTKGYDTYDSDSRFEVYPKDQPPECEGGEECHG